MFDIHTYGRELLTKLEVLGGVDSPVLFCRAVAGHQPYDISRYFLAGLQLVRRLSVVIVSLHTIVLSTPQSEVPHHISQIHISVQLDGWQFGLAG